MRPRTLLQSPRAQKPRCTSDSTAGTEKVEVVFISAISQTKTKTKTPRLEQHVEHLRENNQRNERKVGLPWHTLYLLWCLLLLPLTLLLALFPLSQRVHSKHTSGLARVINTPNHIPALPLLWWLDHSTGIIFHCRHPPHPSFNTLFLSPNTQLLWI